MSNEITDRALLEFAAKAAGIKSTCWIDKTHEWFQQEGVGYDDSNDCQQLWNPLIDDGDALRLAVKLKLSIESDALIEVDYIEGIGCEYEYGCEVWIVLKDASSIKSQELYNDDADAATRRAIVQVAARIGITL